MYTYETEPGKYKTSLLPRGAGLVLLPLLAIGWLISMVLSSNPRRRMTGLVVSAVLVVSVIVLVERAHAGSAHKDAVYACNGRITDKYADLRREASNRGALDDAEDQRLEAAEDADRAACEKAK